MKLKFFFLLLITFLIFNSSLLTGTVRYVSKTGSSTPPYTSWESSADSIQKCINICSFGDTVYVANGEYQELVRMIPGLSLIGAGMDSCVIESRSFPLTTPFYTIGMADSCLLSGFSIYSHNSFLNTAVRQKNSVVKYCNIQFAYAGIDITATLQDKPLAYKNIILNVENGILITSTKALVTNNIIYALSGGLGSRINSNPIYTDNTIVLNTTQAYLGYGGGFHIQSILKNNEFYITRTENSEGMYQIGDSIINNVITGAPMRGIFTAAGGVIINNVIKGAETGIQYDTGSGEPVLQYNNSWNNQLNYKYLNPDSTNINFDPMFVNEDSMDLHLQKYSPLIDTGDPNILDKDGSRSDIGVFGGPFGESYKYLDLAPRAPINLTALVDTNTIFLSWNRNTEADTSYYKVYRDTVVEFTIDSTKLISSQTDTFFVQINPHNVSKYVYKATCVDKQGNESEPSEEVVVNITSVSIDDYPMTINDYRLYQNFPNPFNPSTTISYRLKERGYVKLYVYDIKGELVSVLVNKAQEAGFYQVNFNVNSQMSNVKGNIASGIYIYQIHIIGETNIPAFTDFNKMILIK